MKKTKHRVKKQPPGQKRSVEAVREIVEAFIPEFAARVAAIKRLLVEKNVCTYKDLREARRFVDMKAEMRTNLQPANTQHAALCTRHPNPMHPLNALA